MAEAKVDLRAFVARAIAKHPYMPLVDRALGSGSSYTGAEVDKALASLGLRPTLHHIALSNRLRTRLGDGLHIPVAVSEHAGGRKSLLGLDVGEEIQTGTVLIEERAYHQYFTRLRDSGKPAGKANYKERMTTADGKAVYEEIYQMTQIDEHRGVVHLRPYADTFKSSMADVIVYHDGICYVCIGSVWWCGLPCLPIPRGPKDDGPLDPIGV